MSITRFGGLALGLVLDPGVEVLGVLADDDEIDVLVARADARVRLARPEQAYSSSSWRSATLTERKPVPIGVVIGPFSATPLAFTDASVVLGERCAGLLHDVDARLADVPVEVDARRLEDAAGRLGELRPGPVAGDEGDAMGHGLRRS